MLIEEVLAVAVNMPKKFDQPYHSINPYHGSCGCNNKKTCHQDYDTYTNQLNGYLWKKE